MTQEPLTLYKLIVLYLLDRATFPLTAAQISDFILEKEYTNYLTLQQVIHELTQSGLIRARTLSNRRQLILTPEGQASLSYFENRIGHAIKAEIQEYLQENGLEMRSEISVTGNYYKTTDGTFETALTASEKDTVLLSLKLNVPTEELAVSVCDNWQKKNREIYQYLTSSLF